MAANSGTLFFAFVVCLIALCMTSVDALFPNHVYFSWGANQASITGDGEDLQLVLTNRSGSGIKTKQAFLFGTVEMLIKLVPGNSAGTVTAYYLSSTGTTHDEIDFEFLGNVSGEPYTVHTNVFNQGVGKKEQQFQLWFDPTADYHNYTIHWNPKQIVWFIDGLPIRVFNNYESQGIAFPNKQGMWLYSSLWNANEWATQGGRVKIDWSCAPFTAKFKNFRPRACIWDGPESITKCAADTPENWWTSPVYSNLSYRQIRQMKWVRKYYMIYNYCTDYRRFNWTMPPECSIQERSLEKY